MRTTIDIPDETYRELKIRAAMQGTTVRKIILDGLAGTLRPAEAAISRSKLPFPVVRSRKPGSLQLGEEGVYEAFLETRRAQWNEEPEGIDPVFCGFTSRDEASTKQWAEGYLAAFSVAARMRLVTFDRALAASCRQALLLA
jgi:hypothetical protein